MIEIPFCFLEGTAPCDHADGLNPPTSKLEAAAALIFLLLDSNSNCLLEVEEPDCLGNIEEAWIKARLFFLFFSNFDENFTCAAAAVSSLAAGSSLMPRPIFLDADSSSATLFF